jgi:hypothetical protein
MEGVAAALEFPDYFGQNWDAMDECLQDLTWLPAGTLALVHAEVPPVPPDILTTYLKLLREAVAYWQTKRRDFRVVFPQNTRSVVEQLFNH